VRVLISIIYIYIDKDWLYLGYINMIDIYNIYIILIIKTDIIIILYVQSYYNYCIYYYKII